MFGIIIGANVLISLGSLVGILTLMVNKTKLNKWLLNLVALSAGGLMGAAFLHLLPDSMQDLGIEIPLGVMLIAFMGFFLMEKILHWRHCHKQDCKVHILGHMNLIGDGVHNFIDGLIIAAAFMGGMKLGLITTLAVALHEIPQEIGDFGVLLYSGWEKKKALIANLGVALISVIGGVVGYYLSQIGELTSYLMAVAAGGFMYIAASDLLPEIRKETNLMKSLGLMGMFVAGVGLMYGFKALGLE